MAEPTLDNYGNFRTSPGPQPPVSTPTSNALGNLTGSGSPEGVVSASPGAGYVDLDSGTLYVKLTGTGDTGWSAVSGGSGTTQVFKGVGAPSSTPIGAALYYDTSTGILYQWSGSAWQ